MRNELAEAAAERLIRYAQVDTQADPDSATYPSTEKQLDLLRMLRDELTALGLDVELDEHGYVFATVPATVDGEVPVIGLLAHADTSPDVSGAGVSPRRVRYDGGTIELGAGTTLGPDDSAALADHVGHDLIVTDGTILLGADDKAGVAEIMAAVAHLVAHPEIPHGQLRIGFNPDEEVGRGTEHFDIDRFGAVAAYTLDGSTVGEIQTETFSAAEVRMVVRGRASHTGTAKGQLVNAIKLAARIVERLPDDRFSPETTEGREGFVHPLVLRGEATEVELRFIVRDFENDLLDRHVEFLRRLAGEVAAEEPRASVELTTEIQYRNMRDRLAQRPEIVERLEEAVRRVGLEPRRTSIRGGTDGSALTEKGLPTPNVYTGGQMFHSEREWICVEDMGIAAATLVELVQVWAGR